MLGGFAGGFGSSMILQMVLKARDEATREIQKVNKEMQGLEKSAWGAGGGLRALISPPVLFGLGALASGLAMSVRAAAESEEAVRGLEAVLKSTGGVAGITKDAALELASSLQQVTRFSDETVINAEKVMLTFTNIGKNVFPDAIKAALDMSTVLGTDLQSSVIQIGKALQDPILGVTALRRVGVNFNETQIKIIKDLVESNKLFEAQTFILKELQTEFGGAAEAAGETFAGQIDRLNNQIGELQERIGRGLIPILSDIAEGALNVFRLSEEVQRLNQRAKELGMEGLPALFTLDDFEKLAIEVAEADRKLTEATKETTEATKQFIHIQVQAYDSIEGTKKRLEELRKANIETRKAIEEHYEQFKSLHMAAYSIVTGLDINQVMRDFNTLVSDLGSFVLPSSSKAFAEWNAQLAMAKDQLAVAKEELETLRLTAISQGIELGEQEKERVKTLEEFIKIQEAAISLMLKSQPELQSGLTETGKLLQGTRDFINEMAEAAKRWADSMFLTDLQRMNRFLEENKTTFNDIITVMGADWIQAWIQSGLSIGMFISEAQPRLQEYFDFLERQGREARTEIDRLREGIEGIPFEKTTIITTVFRTIREQISRPGIQEFGHGGEITIDRPTLLLVGEYWKKEKVRVTPLEGGPPGLLIADGGGGTIPPPPTRAETDILSLKEAQNLGLISPTTTGIGGGGGGGGGAAILPAPILQAAQQLQEATRSITATIPQVAEMAQPRLTAVNVSFQTLIGGPTEDQLTQLARLIVSKINEQNRRVIGLPGR